MKVYLFNLDESTNDYRAGFLKMDLDEMGGIQYVAVDQRKADRWMGLLKDSTEFSKDEWKLFLMHWSVFAPGIGSFSNGKMKGGPQWHGGIHPAWWHKTGIVYYSGDSVYERLTVSGDPDKSKEERFENFIPPNIKFFKAPFNDRTKNQFSLELKEIVSVFKSCADQSDISEWRKRNNGLSNRPEPFAELEFTAMVKDLFYRCRSQSGLQLIAEDMRNKISEFDSIYFPMAKLLDVNKTFQVLKRYFPSLLTLSAYLINETTELPECENLRDELRKEDQLRIVLSFENKRHIICHSKVKGVLLANLGKGVDSTGTKKTNLWLFCNNRESNSIYFNRAVGDALNEKAFICDKITELLAELNPDIAEFTTFGAKAKLEIQRHLDCIVKFNADSFSDDSIEDFISALQKLDDLLRRFSMYQLSYGTPFGNMFKLL